jgi:hypothetical protein
VILPCFALRYSGASNFSVRWPANAEVGQELLRSLRSRQKQPSRHDATALMSEFRGHDPLLFAVGPGSRSSTLASEPSTNCPRAASPGVPAGRHATSSPGSHFRLDVSRQRGSSSPCARWLVCVATEAGLPPSHGDLATRMLSVPLANDLTDGEVSRIRALLTKPATSGVAHI